MLEIALLYVSRKDIPQSDFQLPITHEHVRALFRRFTNMLATLIRYYPSHS